MSAESKYRDALYAAPQSGEGRTHSWMMGTANLAALAGVDSATAQREMADALGPRGKWKAAELRDTVAKAYRERGERYEAPRERWDEAAVRRRKEKERMKVERFSPFKIFADRGAMLGEADLWEASPVHPDWEPEEGWKDAWVFLRALFSPDELVTCGWDTRKEARTCLDWCKAFRAGEEIPPLVIINPIKREGGMTKGENPHRSFACDDAVGAFRHCLVEFDGEPIERQIQFWLGFGLADVTAMTFSGNKSVHAAFRVDAGSREEYEALTGKIYKQFGIANADRACANPSRSIRLAGALRTETGKRQKLLYSRTVLR